ncbi:MAG: hypothetical protein KDI66_19800, partial [Xanthomonadales bacterium]|nr:hypothetical protein [Xanthomonadales bacterium]
HCEDSGEYSQFLTITKVASLCRNRRWDRRVVLGSSCFGQRSRALGQRSSSQRLITDSHSDGLSQR